MVTEGTVRFSRRQRLILSLLCQGQSPKEIAATLEIADGTANTHIRRLYAIAGVNGDRQLILYAMQQPQSMRKDRECRRGLHAPAGSECACPYCLAMLIAA